MVKETKKELKKTNKKSATPKKEVAKAKKTVSKKKTDVKKVEKKQKVGLFKRIGNWVKSVFKEVSKVKWPSKKELVKYSIVTIVFIVFFALFFYAIELLMALLKTLV